MKDVLHVLIVEDDAVTAAKFADWLTKNPAAPHMTTELVSTIGGAANRLNLPGVDAVVLDLMLPNGSGVALVKQLQSRFPAVPVVVVTGLEDSYSVDAIHSGAQEFLLKGMLTPDILARAVRHAVVRHEVRAQHKPLEEAVAGAVATVGQLKSLCDKAAGT